MNVAVPKPNPPVQGVYDEGLRGLVLGEQQDRFVRRKLAADQRQKAFDLRLDRDRVAQREKFVETSDLVLHQQDRRRPRQRLFRLGHLVQRRLLVVRKIDGRRGARSNDDRDVLRFRSGPGRRAARTADDAGEHRSPLPQRAADGNAARRARTTCGPITARR